MTPLLTSFASSGISVGLLCNSFIISELLRPGLGVKVVESSLRHAAMKRQLSHNPRRHIHRRQFLKEQFASIRDLHKRKIGPILTRLTEVNTPFVIIGRNDSTLATYMNFIFIRAIVHTPPRESRCTMSNHCITLHLSKS